MVRTRRQTTTQSEKSARAYFRLEGFKVEAVPMIRSRDDEFLCIVEAIPGSWVDSKYVYSDQVNDACAAVISKLLTGLLRVTFDITRIHVGQTAVRIYLKWAS